MNVYDFINWFFMYSFLGYLLECIVLSAEYKRPVVDRGFGHGPFCVIYGFGALGACMLLRPVSGSPMELYTASMAMGHYHGTGHSQYYGTAVWFLLVGLQPQTL